MCLQSRPVNRAARGPPPSPDFGDMARSFFISIKFYCPFYSTQKQTFLRNIEDIFSYRTLACSKHFVLFLGILVITVYLTAVTMFDFCSTLDCLIHSKLFGPRNLGKVFFDECSISDLSLSIEITFQK